MRKRTFVWVVVMGLALGACESDGTEGAADITVSGDSDLGDSDPGEPDVTGEVETDGADGSQDEDAAADEEVSSTDTDDGDEDAEPAAPEEIAFTGQVSHAVFGMPIEGATACLWGADPPVCSTTDAGGLFSFSLPASSEVAIAVEGAGVKRALFSFVTESFDTRMPGFLVITADEFQQTTQPLGVVEDPEKGHVITVVNSAGVSPVLTPGPSDGNWFSPNGSWSALPESGTPQPGYILMFNVEPGEAELILLHDSKTCTHQGWPTDDPSRQRVPVEPGVLTSSFLSACN